MRLADRVVALGIGKHQHFSEGHRDAGDWYGFDSTGDSAETFESDWRVAGALMEKMGPLGREYQWPFLVDGKWCMADEHCVDICSNESLPRAIIEACCEALEKDDG